MLECVALGELCRRGEVKLVDFTVEIKLRNG